MILDWGAKMQSLSRWKTFSTKVLAASLSFEDSFSFRILSQRIEQIEQLIQIITNIVQKLNILLCSLHEYAFRRKNMEREMKQWLTAHVPTPLNLTKFPLIRGNFCLFRHRTLKETTFRNPGGKRKVCPQNYRAWQPINLVAVTVQLYRWHTKRHDAHRNRRLCQRDNCE